MAQSQTSALGRRWMDETSIACFVADRDDGTRCAVRPGYGPARGGRRRRAQSRSRARRIWRRIGARRKRTLNNLE